MGPRDPENGPSCPQKMQVAPVSPVSAGSLCVTLPVPQSARWLRQATSASRRLTRAWPGVAMPATTYSC